MPFSGVSRVLIVLQGIIFIRRSDLFKLGKLGLWAGNKVPQLPEAGLEVAIGGVQGPQRALLAELSRCKLQGLGRGEIE